MNKKQNDFINRFDEIEPEVFKFFEYLVIALTIALFIGAWLACNIL